MMVKTQNGDYWPICDRAGNVIKLLKVAGGEWDGFFRVRIEYSKPPRSSRISHRKADGGRAASCSACTAGLALR